MPKVLGRSRFWVHTFYAVFLVACLGCSSGITIKHIESTEEMVVGTPWNLPMTQFEVQITRHLLGCTPDNINVETTIEVAPKLALDMNQRYVLSSNGWWATSDIKSELKPDGRSTSLNAKSTDQTAKVITNTLGVIKNVATMGGAVPASKGISNESPEMLIQCNATVVQALQTFSNQKETVEKQTQDLNASTQKVQRYTELAKYAKKYAEALDSALKEQQANATLLAKSSAKLKNAMKLTTHVQNATWPLQSTEFSTTTPFTMDIEALMQWVDTKPNAEKVQSGTGIKMALFRLKPDGSWSIPPLKTKQDYLKGIKKGVPVRLAGKGRLIICRHDQADCSPSATGELVLKSADYPVLQLGQTYIVPATGGHFKAEQAVIALGDDGTPTSIQVVESQAGLVELTGALEEITNLPGQISAGLTANIEAKTSRANAELALLKAEKELAEEKQSQALETIKALQEAYEALLEAQGSN